ncbi:HAD-IA family hydrolase [Shewanella baltica]|uniref:HAD-IA family hydrolase n=1 Tax=Shewanella baltica TaxID=62322 RepID=UPI00217EA52E|nr:HAD-IA family hydrolase [Shewanella baltica]MCS6233601.1 HAD-IA family hydrolase [Shewanella baltica]MCS6268185.1 HAD-IA family hydrolase [Shewanella baltica]
MENNKVEAVIFDLDDTLVRTSSLAQFRESRDKEGLKKNLHKSKLCSPVKQIIDEIKKRNIKLALVSNSPRWYVDEVLNFHNINDFEIIIAYDDVHAGGIKPSPKGINMALKRLGIANPNRCIYIGDQDTDFNAAYYANVKPVAPSWATRHPIEQVPAAILNSTTLINSLDDYNKIGLIADQVAFYKTFNFPKTQLNFAPLNEEGSIVPLNKNDIKLITFGRYFSQGSELTSLYHEKHQLSKDIYAKELSETYVVPQYWVDLLSRVIITIPQYFFENNKSHFDIITVIPSKKGKNKRLENLLKRIEQICDTKSKFIPDIFEFKDGAKSLKTLGSREARKAELDANYILKEKHIASLEGKSILIIDDVITTGATFDKSFSLLTSVKAGVSIGVSVAKTVSIREANKFCPECGSLMKIRSNKKTGIHFWGCCAFYETGIRKCSYTEEIKIKDCPKCEGNIVKRHNNRNNSSFLSCSSYGTSEACGYTESVGEI